MKLTKEETIKTIEICFSNRSCEKCPMGNPDDNCSNIMLKNALFYLKENEPAPSSNDTSSRCNELQINNTMKMKICQAMAKNLIAIQDEKMDELYTTGYLQAMREILMILDTF